ncbi:unnamed protein product, partial [Staurois parvus]
MHRWVALLGTGGWHCWAQVGGTDGYRWAALMGTGGWHCWVTLLGTHHQCPDDQCCVSLAAAGCAPLGACSEHGWEL